MTGKEIGEKTFGFGGRWNLNNFYILSVVQDGQKIIGDWSLNAGGENPVKIGTIKGSIHELEVFGEWRVVIPLESIPAAYRLKSTMGRFEVTISPDGMSFVGKVFDKDVDDTIERPLSGSRINQLE